LQTKRTMLIAGLNRLLLISALNLASTSSLAQNQPDDPPEDYYRAEIVITQRLTDPTAIEERMAHKQVEPVDTEQILMSLDADGSRITDLELVPARELYLNEPANRLERSGYYRVLLRAGWYQSFPPDHQGKSLRVAVGSWLENSGQRAVEGSIKIDRKRFLHVGIHLNHWIDGPQARVEYPPVVLVSVGNTETGDNNSEPGTPGPANETSQEQPELLPPEPAYTEPELATWIRETRRMRSEEIHFIDSPTIGALVFFKRVE